jgi:hypothetical protein
MDLTLPPWKKRDSFHVEPHQRHIDATNRALNLSYGNSAEVHDLGNGKGVVTHEQPSSIDKWRPVKITGDSSRGGAYAIIVGSGTYTGPTNAGTADLSNQGFGTNQAILFNTTEHGLSIHLLPKDGTVITVAKKIGATTNTPSIDLYEATIPLPQHVDITNTASGTNTPVYSVRRYGDHSTNTAILTGVSPEWRMMGVPTGVVISTNTAHLGTWRINGSTIALVNAFESYQSGGCT